MSMVLHFCTLLLWLTVVVHAGPALSVANRDSIEVDCGSGRDTFTFSEAMQFTAGTGEYQRVLKLPCAEQYDSDSKKPQPDPSVMYFVCLVPSDNAFGGLKKGQCVRLKRYTSTESSATAKIEENAERVKAQLDKGRKQGDAKHILRILDIGRDRRGMVLVVYEYVYNWHIINYSQEHSSLMENDFYLPPMFAQTLRPIQEAHKIGATYLDLKPHKWAYVFERGNPERRWSTTDHFFVLQDIDFAAQDADVLATAPSSWWKAHFHSPEVLRHEQLTRKADIWSYGMQVYTMLTEQGRFSDYKTEVTALSDLHKGFMTSLAQQNTLGATPGVPIQLEMDWEKYKYALKLVFLMWRQWPWLAPLITNVLHLEPTVRMSAAGIMDYLRGYCFAKPKYSYSSQKEPVPQMNCVPAEWKAKPLDQIAMFGPTTVGQLRGWLATAAKRQFCSFYRLEQEYERLKDEQFRNKPRHAYGGPYNTKLVPTAEQSAALARIGTQMERNREQLHSAPCLLDLFDSALGALDAHLKAMDAKWKRPCGVDEAN